MGVVLILFVLYVLCGISFFAMDYIVNSFNDNVFVKIAEYVSIAFFLGCVCFTTTFTVLYALQLGSLCVSFK